MDIRAAEISARMGEVGINLSDLFYQIRFLFDELALY